MYHVLIGDLQGNNNILYYPSDVESSIFDTELRQKVGQCGEFTFKVPSTNRAYNEVKEMNIVTIMRDDAEYWRGFIREISSDFNKTLTVYCVEDLAWLALEFFPPENIISTPTQELRRYVDDFYCTLLGVAGTAKEMHAGYMDFVSTGTTNFIVDYGMTLLESLRRLDPTGQSFVRVRRQYGQRYIDIVNLENYGKRTTQAIEFGSNLLDYVKNIDTSDMFNVIYPYGQEQKDVFVSEDFPERVKGTPLADNNSIALYGRIARTVVFDDMETPEEVDEVAGDYLKAHTRPLISLELSALDLSDLKMYASDKINIGDQIEVIAEPYGFYGGGVDLFYVIEKTTDIQNADNNKIILASEYIDDSSLTDTQIDTIKALEDLPSESAILQAAKQNALNLLNNNDGGYISYEFNDQEQMIAQHIANSLDITTATKDWVWNINGFGYRTRQNAGQEWNNIKAAITMDGAIVADFITTGIMSADRIQGGQLVIGGSAYLNGVANPAYDGSIRVKDEKNTDIVRIDRNGIGLLAGTKIAWEDVNHPSNLATTNDIPKDYIATATTLYYAGSSKPNKPTSKVTSTSTSDERWTTVIPNISDKCWQCVQYETKNGVSFSTVYEYVDSAVTTVITQNTVTTSYVNALKVTAKDFEANSVKGKIFYKNKNNYITFKSEQGSDDPDLANYNYYLQFYDSKGGGFTVIDAQGRLYAQRYIICTKYSNIAKGTELVDLNESNFTIYDGEGKAFNTNWVQVYLGLNNIDSSDRRLKNTIKKVDVSESLRFLKSADIFKFYYNEDSEKLQYGVVAQDLIESLNDNRFDAESLGVIDEGVNGYYSVRYQQFTPHLINVVNEQQREIETLKSEVNELKDLVNKLLTEGRK